MTLESKAGSSRRKQGRPLAIAPVWQHTQVAHSALQTLFIVQILPHMLSSTAHVAGHFAQNPSAGLHAAMLACQTCALATAGDERQALWKAFLG